ncbi:exopolysaccharide biosynthesis polyprenyl glycosylphosphotransferase [Dactylosporangium sp. NPDC000555]|uniref:exopolysaccharide biosynthesis polyprenyl glycosylphosphotransferase n=1 Tax=Dactylosporangium sp. NPDC000555 TaxID=3154260 RepID=UPI00331FC422
MAIDSGRTRDGFHRPAHLRRDRPRSPAEENWSPAEEERKPAEGEPDRRLASAANPVAPIVSAPVYGRPAGPARGRRPRPARNAVRQVPPARPSASASARVQVAAPVSPAPGLVPPAEVDPELAAEVEDAVRGGTPFVRTPGRPAALVSGPPEPTPMPARVAPEPGAGAGRASRHRARWAWEGRYLRTLLVLDFTIGLLAGAAAFEARFSNGLTTYNSRYVLLSTLLPIAFIASLAANRAYEKRYLFVGTDEYQRVLRAGLALTAATVFVAYATETRIARGWFVVALPLVTFACLLARFLLRKLLHRARKRRGACMRRVVVVGHELAVEAMARQLCRERYHGLKVVGACLPTAGTVAEVPILGTFDEIAGAVRKARADTVLVLSCPELDGHALRRLAWHLERDDIDLIVASTLIDVAGSRTTIRPVDGLPMLHVEHPTLTGARRLVKALVDRVGAAALLVLVSPLLAFLALAVRVDSRGPVLFRQVRVGKDGHEFVIFKFRTMHIDAEARLAELRHLNEVDGALFKLRNDPRVTRVGRLLRKFSLDELPQLLNVIGGSMSLVGPRPPLPEEVAVYPDDARRRLAVRPGMTGLWQVSGRSDLSWDEAVRLDLQYVENWSLSLDLVIMLRTLSAVTRGAGAY